MNEPANLNLPIPESLVDRAYDVMTAELDHWQVVGPQREGGIEGGREFWTATRAPEQTGHAVILKPEETQPKAQSFHFQHFKDKPYAIAYVQWNSLKAVLSDPEIQNGLSKLAGVKPN